MAGGIHLFSTKESYLILNVEHDKEYDLMQIAERFEVPYVDLDRCTTNQRKAYAAMMEVKSKQVGKYAIETYTRLRHWKFYDKRPVELDTSEGQIDLDEFSTSRKVLLPGVNQGSIIDRKGTVAYVLKMWFIVPKQRVEVITPEPDDPDVEDGFVNPHNIEGYQATKDKVTSNG